jgi:hypothetical protein
MPTRSTPFDSQKLLPLVSDAFSSVVSASARGSEVAMILLRYGLEYLTSLGFCLAEHEQ